MPPNRVRRSGRRRRRRRAHWLLVNLDGTAIYLTMASLFVAEAAGTPFSIGEQISLLLFMIIASEGAAGVAVPGWRRSPVASTHTAPTWWTALESSTA